MTTAPDTRRRPDGAALTVAAVLALIAVIIFRDVATLPQNRGYSGVGPADTAGFVIATALLFAATARAFGKRNLALTLPIGLIFTGTIYLVFSQLLNLSLPAGPLERLITGG